MQVCSWNTITSNSNKKHMQDEFANRFRKLMQEDDNQTLNRLTPQNDCGNIAESGDAHFGDNEPK